MKNRFQSLPFKFNLQRYSEDLEKKFLKEAGELGLESLKVGGYTS